MEIYTVTYKELEVLNTTGFIFIKDNEGNTIEIRAINNE